MDKLEQLHGMLSRIPLSDDEIIGGLQLSNSGIARIGKKLSLDEKGVALLFAQLQTRIRKNNPDLTSDLNEGDEDARFSYETDFLENVTIRDATMDREVFLQGSKASDFLNKVGKGNDQAVMAAYAPLMESDDDHWAHYDKSGFYGAQAAGCVIIARSTGRILLPHRSELEGDYAVEQPGTWGTWGGAMDRNETPQQAVRRELGEEAGYHGKLLAMEPLLVFKKGDFRYHNFLVIVEDEFVPHLNWESQGYRWCTFGEWPRPMHFGLKALLNDASSKKIIEDAASETTLDEADGDNWKIDDDSFDAEIESKTGTFNFPWTIRGRQGFGCARFSGRGPSMSVVILSASDTKGNTLDIKPIAQELVDCAKAFIGHE